MNLNNLNIDLDAQYLPKEYRRIETIRFGRPGTAKPKISTQYIDERTGMLFKTKGQLQSYLLDKKVDLSMLDFNTGKLSPFLIKKNLRKSKTKYMQPPVRQQIPLNKKAVNVLKPQTTSKVNNELQIQGVSQDKPRQVFWEKRLSCYNKTDDEKKLNLPKNIKQFGPEVDAPTAVRSIAAALHLHSNLGIVGQTDSTKVAEKNPSVFINPDQPLVHSLVITEEDLLKQEERVKNARKKLAMIYKDSNLVV